jgi:hypothetical protein
MSSDAGERRKRQKGDARARNQKRMASRYTRIQVIHNNLTDIHMYDLIVFGTASELLTGNGIVHSWYQTMTAALEECRRQSNTYYQVTIVRIV